MKIIKQILFSLLSLFLLYFSFTTLRQIVAFGPEQLGFKSSLFLGFIINLCVTGIFAFPGFVFPTNKALPENYYIIKNPSMLIHWYKALGVKYFQKLLIIFFWGKKTIEKSFWWNQKRVETIYLSIQAIGIWTFWCLGSFAIYKLIVLNSRL